MMQTMIGITEARERFKELVETVANRDVTVLKHNRPVVMMISPERLERLYERLADAEDERDVLLHKLEGDDRRLVKHGDVMAGED